MVCNLPSTQPEPFQSILADLQNKIDGLPEGYREAIQADLQKLSAVFARQPAAVEPAAASPAALPAASVNPIEQVLDSLIAGVLVFDQAGMVRMANDYAVSLFGFNPLGMRHDNFLIRLKATGEDGKRIPNEHMPSSRASQGEVVPNQALTITVPHGRKYHVLASAMPLFSGSQVSGVVCIWNDVTGPHNMDEEIRQQKDLLETVLNSSPYGLAILSGPDLHYRYTNRAFRGLSPDLADPDGRPLRSVWRSEVSYRRARAIIDQVMDGGETIYTPQMPIEQPDGTLRYFATHVTRITWEQQPAALVMIWDVTETVTARTSIQQRAAEFQAIFEAISDAVLVFDAAGQIVRANTASAKVFGFDAQGLDRQELIRRLALSRPDGTPFGMDELISSRVLAGQQVRDLPFQIRGPQGQALSMLGSGSPLVDPDGGISGAVSIWHDVSDREQQAQQLLEANAALRQNQAVLDAFFAASPGVLLLLDEEFRFLKTDPRTPLYFNLECQDMLGKGVGELSSQLIADNSALLRRVVETGQPVLNVEGSGLLPNRPGEITYWRASFFPVPLPQGKRGLGVVAMDISDIRRIEEVLRSQEVQLRDCQSSVQTSGDC